MVDLAIASNFARELTEEQFGESRRRSRRRPAAEAAAAPAVGRQVGASGAGDRHAGASRGFARSTFGRVMSRLVHVRG